MYVHGGVVGITKVARNFPWLTRLITYLVRLSDPDHHFTSVGISCNACAEPHRDSYNSERHDNLVIPLEYPDTGGEIWVAKAPHARQQSQERLCGSKELSGTLVALKPALHLNPHCWRATASWTGNRILSIGYSLKASHKLVLQDRNWLKNLGSEGEPISLKAPARAYVCRASSVFKPFNKGTACCRCLFHGVPTS